MSLNSSQVVNNMKRSFNRYIGEKLGDAAVNYDVGSFNTERLTEWYAVRYTNFCSESVGMGDSIDEGGTRGRFHVLECELSAWCRGDRAALGEMADMLTSSCEIPSIPLYDFADPENPVACGKIYLRLKDGKFVPSWGPHSQVLKSSSDIYLRAGIVGFILNIELITIAEVN